MKRIGAVLVGLAAAFILSACGEKDQEAAEKRAETAAGASSASYSASDSGSMAAAPAKPQNAVGRKTVVTSAARAGEASARRREIADPDGYTLAWIHYDWSGEIPDFDAVAERSGLLVAQEKGYAVNQFNRQTFIDEEKARLEALFAEGRGVGTVVMNISGQLSEYDPGYGEFYIGAFSPGSSFAPRAGAASVTASWSSAVRNARMKLFRYVQIKPVNALDAYVWKMSRDEAVKLIARMESEGNTGRNIYARARLKILDVSSHGEQSHEIRTQIQSFTLFTAKGTQLAAFDLVK